MVSLLKNAQADKCALEKDRESRRRRCFPKDALQFRANPPDITRNARHGRWRRGSGMGTVRSGSIARSGRNGVPESSVNLVWRQPRWIPSLGKIHDLLGDSPS
jgi:hypothetical protein